MSVEVQSRNRLCPQCGSDLHCCKNCVHYDEKLASKCREPNGEWIADRAAVNDCPYFEFAQTKGASDEGTNAEAERAKEAFRALFRTP